MEIKSYIKDHKIEAVNVLVELTIGDYLEIARDMLKANDFQRKRVIRSTVSKQLKEDLRVGCTIPPIILALAKDATDNSFDYKKIEDDSIRKFIEEAFKNKKLSIVDGLQRTNVLLELEKDLLSDNSIETLMFLKKQKIRTEVYVGIDRLGILYRMITHNTGQQAMSLRHLTEILYYDYTKIKWERDIKFITQKSGERAFDNTTEFSFKMIIDGFNSYISGVEFILTKTDVLSNIRNIKKIEELRKNQEDAFKDFVLIYQSFLEKINIISDDWQYNEDDITGSEMTISNSPFGKSPIKIFKSSPALTGFGATLGILNKKGINTTKIEKVIHNLTVDDTFSFYNLMIKRLDMLREESKRIGDTQRTFFMNFFRALLTPDSNQVGQFMESVQRAYDQTSLHPLEEEILA